jgi:D-alanyl-D-alanine endopeptidase (penicillin-binding protein 7)
MGRHYTLTDMRVLKQLSHWLVALAVGGASFGALAQSDSTPSASSTSSARPHKATSSRAHAKAASARRPARQAIEPVSYQSFGYAAGLHTTADPLALRSGAVLVLDQDTHEVLYSKNPEAVLPIASLTKLMTAMVVTEANLPLDEKLSITDEDIDTEKGTHSRLTPGTQLSRGVMLHLALMSSENRAANALGRNYPGGMPAFVEAMNAKAKELGMLDTHYVEPTGLSSRNQSSAHDLALLVNAAHEVPLLREYSTTPSLDVELGRRQVQFRTTDRLVANPNWDIGLQKTGFINEAGQCLVMQAQMAGRKFIMVLLDSAGKYSRIGDAERIRKWLMTTQNSASSTKTATPAEAG